MLSEERRRRILSVSWISEIVNEEDDGKYLIVKCNEGHEVRVRTKSVACTDAIKSCSTCRKLAALSKEKSKCLRCGKELRQDQKKFCSKKCSVYFHITNPKVCKGCGKPMPNSKSKIYCSEECKKQQRDAIREEKLKNALSNPEKTIRVPRPIRRHLFAKYNNSCQKCGWNKVNKYTNKVPLQIHHIDGDPSNNDLSNLELLCPNCHSLTETYSCNKGKGRYARRVRRYKTGTSD